MKSLFFSHKSRNKNLQINAIILRFLSVRIMFVNTFLWNFHSKSSFQSNSFLFVQKFLVSLLPANQVFDFFSRYLNALSARKWEKSESQKVWVYFSVCHYPIEFSNLQSLVVAVVKLKVKNLSFKVCEELSARKSCPKSKVCQNRKVFSCRKADSSSKTFQRINLCLSVFHYDT